MEIKQKAIIACLTARRRAICRKTMVGAALYSNSKIYPGFNVENRCHKGYHAEEMAILNAILRGEDPKNMRGIVVSFSNDDIKSLTFMCGFCRQIVWEYTLNPELLVTEVDLDGNIIKEVKLGELYPYPYPREEQVLTNGNSN